MTTTTTSIHNSVETVNAAAAAIAAAESRARPPLIQKRKWGGCWNLCGCFGYQTNAKKIGHAALVPEPTSHQISVPAVETSIRSTSIMLPYIAPPSSPASFLQSDPSTGTHSPSGLLNPASLSANADSQAGPANVFAIGPYANETQLVSPPVFSAFTTEPSTATVTPAETVQLTTPSSPEVPFAQLLTSSLNRTRRNSESHQKDGLSYYEFNQVYSGSPPGYLISPGSVNSASGTSSPYPIKQSLLELRIADASKLFDSGMFATRKWGSRLDSGSLTPDASRDSLTLENQMSELESLSRTEDYSAYPRVSFKFVGEDIPTSHEMKALPSLETLLSSWKEIPAHEFYGGWNGISRENIGEFHVGEDAGQMLGTAPVGEPLDWKHKHSSISFGSIKELNFNGSEIEVQDEQTVSSTWLAEGELEKDVEVQNKWTFSLLQTGVSQLVENHCCMTPIPSISRD